MIKEILLNISIKWLAWYLKVYLNFNLVLNIMCLVFCKYYKYVTIRLCIYNSKNVPKFGKNELWRD